MIDLRQHITEQVDSRIERGGTKQIYRIQRHVKKQYVRDRNCWMADVDLSSASVWNSQGENRRGGCLVTPQHVLMAKHYTLSVGTTVRFAAMHRKVDGRYCAVEDRVVRQVWTDGQTDLAIAWLDSPLPDYIKPAKCLPPNFLEWLPRPHNTIPLIATDQEEKVILQEAYDLNNFPGVCRTTYYRDVTRPEYFETWIGGDSGSPMYMLIRDEAVIMGVAWAVYAAPTVHGNFDLINEQLHRMGNRYQLTVVDLSEFERNPTPV